MIQRFLKSNKKGHDNHNNSLETLPDQILLNVLCFIDLRSVENLQLSNRKIRQRFCSSLWRKLLVQSFPEYNIPPVVTLDYHTEYRRLWLARYALKFKREIESIRNQYRVEGERVKYETWERVMNSRKWKKPIVRIGAVFVTKALELLILVAICIVTVIKITNLDPLYIITESCYSDPNFDDGCREHASSLATIRDIFTAVGSFMLFLGLVFRYPFCRASPYWNYDEFFEDRKGLRESFYGAFCKLILYLPFAISFIVSYISERRYDGYFFETPYGTCTVTATFGVTGGYVCAWVTCALISVYVVEMLLNSFALYWVKRPLVEPLCLYYRR